MLFIYGIRFFGSRRIKTELGDRGLLVNRKKVQRLMRKIVILALYPKKRTSLAGKGHKIYPYLLKDLTIDQPNQVWPRISPIFRWPKASYIVWPLSIGTVGKSCRGAYRTPWTQDFAWRRSRKLSIHRADPRSLIRIRAHNLPVTHSPAS